MPVLNVSSRVFWLELDDKALLDSYAVLQEGILCDVFSQKCSAAWQGARGERLTVGIMLPGRQDADDWLNFMLSQKNLWPTFTTRGTLTEEISEQVFSKERRRLQAKHLWMVVKLRWGVLVDRMYVKAPTGKSKEELDALHSTGPPDATAQTHMKRKSIVVLESKKSRHGGRNVRIGWHTLKNKVNRLSLNDARVRKQARESGQASWPATNARVSQQQTRESAGNKRASQAKKKTIRESPARKRPKEAEHPPENDQKRQSTLLTQRASARWPVGPLSF